MTTRSTLSPARLLDSLRRWRWRLILRWGVAALCFGLGVLIAGVAWLSRDLPSTTRLQMITQSLKTQVLDMNGDVYGSYGIENRVAIPLYEMPRDLINAVLSVEDRRFYEHWGLDILRWPKVLLTDIKIRLRSRSAPLQGASTNEVVVGHQGTHLSQMLYPPYQIPKHRVVFGDHRSPGTRRMIHQQIHLIAVKADFTTIGIEILFVLARISPVLAGFEEVVPYCSKKGDDPGVVGELVLCRMKEMIHRGQQRGPDRRSDRLS